MINVLHVISDTNVGGAGMHLVSLVNSIDKNKFNVFVACPEESQISSLIDSSVTIIKIASMQGDKSFDIKSIYRLIKTIKQNKIDIVHTHASLSGRIAAKIAGAKIIFTRHTPGSIPNKKNIKWKINKYLNVWLCDKVIAVSHYIASQLKTFGIPENKISVIYNGINISSFNQEVDHDEVKKVYGIKDELVLLEIARLEEIKGHRYLLKAVSELVKENYNIKVMFVGGGSKENELKNYTKKLKLENVVIFTGVIKNINPVISISDIVILPSLKEALGLALLEGMCMQKPCIASNVDGIPEVINNNINGFLVEPKDVQGLKNAIKKLMDNPQLREEMGQEGKKIVEEKFSLEKMTKQVEDLYIDLLS